MKTPKITFGKFTSGWSAMFHRDAPVYADGIHIGEVSVEREYLDMNCDTMGAPTVGGYTFEGWWENAGEKFTVFTHRDGLRIRTAVEAKRELKEQIAAVYAWRFESEEEARDRHLNSGPVDRPYFAPTHE